MNKYQKKARKESILSATVDTSRPTDERLGKAATSTGLLLLSGLTGGFVGAATGRWSLLTGIIVAGAGQYTGTPAATAFGLGMATSNVFVGGAETVDGTDEKKKTMDSVKERIKNYGNGLKQKLFLDKILKPKKKEESTTQTTTETPSSDTATNGMGEVQVFKYPGAEQTDVKELERFEKELEKSAQKYMDNTNETSTMTGMDEMPMEERNY